MKTKNLIILATFLLSGLFVTAQSYSDSNKQKSETTKNKFQASEKPVSADFITSFGLWYHLLKIQFVPGTNGDEIMNPADGIKNKRNLSNAQPVEDYPGDPGPTRYYHMNIKENNSRN